MKRSIHFTFGIVLDKSEQKFSIYAKTLDAALAALRVARDENGQLFVDRPDFVGARFKGRWAL